MSDRRVNLKEPYWDQSTFIGRLKYFFWVTDPRTIVVDKKHLNEARGLLDMYRLGLEPPGTTKDQIKYARKLYESAFHPDSGQLMNVLGRMSFQVPGNMIMMGCLLSFYRTNTQVILMQWINQSFNAVVNYTNRNADASLTKERIGLAYVSATACAVATSVGLRTYLLRFTSTILLRFVPFVAVAAANCVNIPLMRQSEIVDGVTLFDKNGNRVTDSRLAAMKGIVQVITSRVSQAVPGMFALPVIMERMEQLSWMKRHHYFNAPIQILFSACSLLIMVPVSCAIFPQRCSINVSTLKQWETKSYAKLQEIERYELIEKLYFNKGL